MVWCDVERNREKEEEEEEEDDDDDDEEEDEEEEEKEEEMTVRKGAKRKRGHECDVCEKVFRYPSHLTRHTRIHTKEKPYECVMCARSVLLNQVI